MVPVSTRRSLADKGNALAERTAEAIGVGERQKITQGIGERHIDAVHHRFHPLFLPAVQQKQGIVCLADQRNIDTGHQFQQIVFRQTGGFHGTGQRKAGFILQRIHRVGSLAAKGEVFIGNRENFIWVLQHMIVCGKEKTMGCNFRPSGVVHFTILYLGQTDNPVLRTDFPQKQRVPGFIPHILGIQVLGCVAGADFFKKITHVLRDSRGEIEEFPVDIIRFSVTGLKKPHDYLPPSRMTVSRIFSSSYRASSPSTRTYLPPNPIKPGFQTSLSGCLMG